MKIILTEKISKLGNIGDVVNVATGYARNYLLPTKKALRFTKANAEIFENQKKDLIAKSEVMKKTALDSVKKVQAIKFYMIRSAGDTGQLYGSVSSRDIAKMVIESGIKIESNQVLLGIPIKTIGIFETEIALHPDVIVPVKIYVAQSEEEIDALVKTGKIKKSDEKTEEKSEETKPAKSEKSEEVKEVESAEKTEETSEEPVKKTKKATKSKKEEIAE